MSDNSIASSSDIQSLADVRASLAQAPQIFRALLTGAPDRALDATEGPGTWSPRQVLCHVLHGETDDWMPRVRILLESGTARAFTPFDREAGFKTYAGWQLAPLLDELDRLRTTNLEALDALRLRDHDLAKEGRHPELGVVTLRQLLTCWATHDWAHVAQIGRVMTRHYGAGVGPWTRYFSLLAEG
jgi:hypothetical protein